jgi:branched-chain amino acid transport system substrate-binding protein
MNKRNIILGILAVMIAVGGYFIWNIKQNSEIIKIGVVAPMTGENAFYGKLLKDNFDLAFENEKNFSLIYEDSKFEQKTSISAFQKLITIDRVKIVLGEVASGNTMAIAPIAGEKKIVLFSSISSADMLKTMGDGYFFRNIPSNDVQGETMARIIYEKLGLRKVALFGLNDDYGVNISESFKNEFLKLGGQIVVNETHSKGQTDFRVVLTKIKQSEAEAIFIPGDKNEPANILRQAKEMNINLPILGGDGSSNDDVLRIAGNSSEGFYTTNVLVNKKSKIYQDYRKIFYSRFNREPSAYDAYAYEMALIVKQTLKNVDYEADEIRKYLINTEFESMTGLLHFSENGQVDRLWGVYKVLNGKFVEIEF